LGQIGYWSVGVIAFDAEPSAMISFAILACASRFTGVTACVYLTFQFHSDGGRGAK